MKKIKNYYDDRRGMNPARSMTKEELAALITTQPCGYLFEKKRHDPNDGRTQEQIYDDYKTFFIDRWLSPEFLFYEMTDEEWNLFVVLLMNFTLPFADEIYIGSPRSEKWQLFLDKMERFVYHYLQLEVRPEPDELEYESDVDELGYESDVVTDEKNDESDGVTDEKK